MAILGITAAGFAAEAQQPGNAAAGFNDPLFWSVVDAGPRTSEELELVATTYAANGMTDEATNTFVRYLSRPDPESDPVCEYCSSLLATVKLHEAPSPLAAAVREAIKIVGDQAAQAGSGDRLIRLALVTSESDFSEHEDLSLYLLSAAAQFGIDDVWRDDVVRMLVTFGLYADALTIAESLYADVRSAHYESADLAAWIRYIERLIERDRAVGAIVAAAATN
jgi:hypothetical protein